MGGGLVNVRDYLNKYNVNDTCMPVLSVTRLYKHFMLMREEILKHKWCESEKAGKDVGFEYALLDWHMHHRRTWTPDTSDK